MMKGVMMLVNYFPPLPTGGAERQAERLAAYMGTHGVKTSVLTRKVGDLPAYENKDIFDIYRLSQFGPGKLKTVTFTIAAMVVLLIRNRNYDILHAHLAFAPAVAAVLAGKIVGKRTIVKFGNSAQFGDVQDSKRTWLGRFRMAILRRWADIVIVLDTQMEAEALGDGFARDRVIRMDNGIASDDFTPQKDKDTAKQALDLELKTAVLFTGRLMPQKDLPVLLLAVQKTLQSCPDMQVVLLGHGEEKETLVALAHQLEIADRVIFRDPVTDVRPYLNAADIFVLPSLAEGISNSLLEAMSAGLPCITTRVGGSPTVLDDGKCGLLISPGDVEELAETLRYLYNHPAERAALGTKARQRILDRYDFKRVGQRYHSLYKDLLEMQ